MLKSSSAQPRKKKTKRKLAVADATLLMDPSVASETLMMSETMMSQTLSNATMSETLLEPIRTGSTSSSNDQKGFACDVIEVIISNVTTIYLSLITNILYI